MLDELFVLLALSSLHRLLGREIDVDLNAGIFVTLNPAGKKYGGRSKLPDNLKALFRPVAMGRPDNELIAEVRGMEMFRVDVCCCDRRATLTISRTQHSAGLM